MVKLKQSCSYEESAVGMTGVQGTYSTLRAQRGFNFHQQILLFIKSKDMKFYLRKPEIFLKLETSKPKVITDNVEYVITIVSSNP